MIMTGIVRLGRDADVRHIASGEAVCKLSLVFNYGRKGSEGKQASQWLDASLWGKRAESLAPYLTKGSQLSVVLDEPHSEEYEGKNGKSWKLVARVISIEFVGKKPADDNHDEPAESPKKPNGVPFDDLNDDIPF